MLLNHEQLGRVSVPHQLSGHCWQALFPNFEGNEFMLASQFKQLLSWQLQDEEPCFVIRASCFGKFVHISDVLYEGDYDLIPDEEDHLWVNPLDFFFMEDDYCIGVDGHLELLAQLKGTIHHDPATQHMLVDYLNNLDQRGFVPYTCSKEVENMLLEEGVPVPEIKLRHHSHGGHKHLENFLYSQVYPGLVGPKVDVAFCKTNKFQFFKNLVPKYNSLWNEKIDAKDRSRYDSPEWPDKLDSPELLLWDAGHYLTPASTAALFAKYPDLHTIHAGCVLPAETSERDSSMYPQFYQLEYFESMVRYLLEGSDQGAYEQPLAATWLLHPSRFDMTGNGEQVTFYSTPMVRLFAHTLVTLSRNPTKVSTPVWRVTSPGLISIPSPWVGRLFKTPVNGNPLVPEKCFTSVLHYKRNLKKRLDLDTMTKIRNQMILARYSYVSEAAWEQIRMAVEVLSDGGFNEMSKPTYTNSLFASITAAIANYFSPSDPQKLIDRAVSVAISIMAAFLPTWLAVPTQVFAMVKDMASCEHQWQIGVLVGKSVLCGMFPTVTAVLATGYAVGLGFGFYYYLKDARSRQFVDMALGEIKRYAFETRRRAAIFEPEEVDKSFSIVRPMDLGTPNDAPFESKLAAFLGEVCKFCSERCVAGKLCPKHSFCHLHGKRNTEEIMPMACCRITPQQVMENQGALVQAKAAVVRRRQRNDVELNLRQVNRDAAAVLDVALPDEALSLYDAASVTATETTLLSGYTSSVDDKESLASLPPLTVEDLDALEAEVTIASRELIQAQVLVKRWSEEPTSTAYKQAAANVLLFKDEKELAVKKLAQARGERWAMVAVEPSTPAEETEARLKATVFKENLDSLGDVERERQIKLTVARQEKRKMQNDLDDQEVVSTLSTVREDAFKFRRQRCLDLIKEEEVSVVPAALEEGVFQEPEPLAPAIQVSSLQPDVVEYTGQGSGIAREVTPAFGIDPHVSCSCERHTVVDGYTSWQSARYWKSCLSGHGTWFDSDVTENTHPCHACPGVHAVVYSSGEATMAVHEVLDVAASNVHYPDSRNTRITPGLVRAQTPETCLLNAISEATNLSTEKVWRLACLNIGHQASIDLLPSPGLDERFLCLVYTLLKRTAKVYTPNKTTPPLLGWKSGLTDEFRLTTLNGVPHWEFLKQKERKPKQVKTSVKMAHGTERFLTAMDRFVSDLNGKVLGSWNEHVLRSDRAKLLASDMKNGIEGVMKRCEGRVNGYRDGSTASIDAMVDGYELEEKVGRSRSIKFRNLAGVAGCGKSDPLFKFLMQHKSSQGKGVWKYSAPRKSLRDAQAAAMKLGINAYQLGTWEKAFAVVANVLIVEEVSLAQPGLVELYCLVQPGITHVMILGDPIQCNYNPVSPDSKLSRVSVENPEALFWFRKGGVFLTDGHRHPQIIARAIAIRSTNPEEGSAKIAARPDKRFPLIVATDAEAKAWSAWGYRAMTVPSAQGSTEETIQIKVSTQMVSAVQLTDAYSAVMRTTKNIIFVNGLKGAELVDLSSHPIFGAILGTAPVFPVLQKFSHLLQGLDLVPISDFDEVSARRRQALVDKINLKTGAVVQRSNGQYTEAWERGSGFLKAHLLSSEAPPLPEVNRPDENLPVTLKMTTHLPTPDADFILNKLEEGKVLDRWERELVGKHGPSETLVDSEERLQRTGAWFQKQKATDKTLMDATIEKRMARGTAEENMQNYIDAELTADLLFEGYLYATKIQPAEFFDWELFSECINENEQVKLFGKTIATHLANAHRAAPDGDRNMVSHFLKTQLKGKMEAFCTPAKAGQTLACIHDEIIVWLGAVNRYLRHVEARTRTPRIFIHSGTSNTDLNDHHVAHWRDGPSTTSDYTNFDSTQRGESIGLWVRTARYQKLPENLIELYVYWKINTSSNIIGPKRSGRETGECGTYDDNCKYNLAIVGCQYLLWHDPAEPLSPPDNNLNMDIGGDDFAADAHLIESPRWKVIKLLVYTVSKVEYTTRPVFCGFYLTSRGIYKDPQLLMLKLLYHEENGTLDDIADSYACESSFAYHMAEDLHSYASFEDLMAQRWILDLFHERYPHIAFKLFSQESLALSLESYADWLRSTLFVLEGITRKQRGLMEKLNQKLLIVQRRLSKGFFLSYL